MKRLRWLITAPLALILIVLAVNNRHAVDLSLWPFGATVSWPLFVLIYIGVLAGFLAGAVVAWGSIMQHRRRARHREADKAVKKAAAGRQTATERSADRTGVTPPATTD